MSGHHRSRTTSPADGGRNLVVIEGTVRVGPIQRTRTDATVLLIFDVVTRVDGSRMSLPVSWIGPAVAVPDIAAGTEVAVLGTVQRRFFRAGGSTVSAVDVRATHVARTPAARRKVVAAARALLELQP